MIEKQPCPFCEATRDVEETAREETLTKNGKEITFNARFFKCTVCGGEFESAEQMDSNLDAARETYARLYETPSPDALRTLRARYGASQKAFGLMLGFGELTMNSYEQGKVPDSANRVLLRLAKDPYCFKAMYMQNKWKIGEIQRRRIEISEGFKASAWIGLDALESELTQMEKEKVEHCAEHNGLTLLKQVSVFVKEGSFALYSTVVMKEPEYPQLMPSALPAFAPTEHGIRVAS